MHTKRELLELLRCHGIRLKKRLGQHYFIDPRLGARLVSVCDLAAGDTVIEIGAGLGALTDLLAAKANQVIAIEVDRAICELLKARMENRSNVQVLCHDILTFRWNHYAGSKVVGTIPYHITSPILVNLCEHASAIVGAWLGLQEEVAQRLNAKPGTKAYGRLTVLIQYHFETAGLLRIPRTAFFPQPKVNSMWIRLAARHVRPVLVTDERLFFDVVRVAFSQRRKTLLNCLQTLPQPRLDRTKALEAIRRAGLADRVRGEELSLEAFAKLANTIDETKSP
jgi:16S rRNA (adenine1518-N6/adenine1519-N6)-dimethyltransferase